MHGILALKVGLFVIKQVTSGLAERHCPYGDRINCGGQVDANHSINSKVIKGNVTWNFPWNFLFPYPKATVLLLYSPSMTKGPRLRQFSQGRCL